MALTARCEPFRGVPEAVITDYDTLTVGLYCKILMHNGDVDVEELAKELSLPRAKVLDMVKDLAAGERIIFEGAKKGRPALTETEMKQNRMQERLERFKNECFSFGNEFPEAMIQKFIAYWSEPNKSQTRMRWEMQPTWETHRRLRTWASKDYNQVPSVPRKAPISIDEAIDEIYG